MNRVVKTVMAPEPVGPYNQAIIAGTLIFTAGQIAINPENGELVKEGIKEQTRLVLENLKAVLVAAGAELSDVVKTTVFLKDMNDFQAMNEVYAEYFRSNAPARSAVEVARLPKDVLVEMECIASLGK